MTSEEAISHIKAMIESLEIGIKAIESNKEWEGVIPSVQPKIGRWGFVKHYGRGYYRCSYCGMERMDDYSTGWNYCPACGAKMEGDADAGSDWYTRRKI